jgi:ankyrin repeat protein
MRNSSTSNWNLDTNATDANGETALHEAVRSKKFLRIHAVNSLLRANVDREKQNKDGKTALDLVTGENEGDVDVKNSLQQKVAPPLKNEARATMVAERRASIIPKELGELWSRFLWLK